MDKEQYLRLRRKYGFHPALIFGPLPLGLLILAALDPSVPLLRGAGLFLAGVLWWTLLEYVMHRFVAHPSPGRAWTSRTSEFHMLHHAAPRDREFLSTSVLVTVPLYVVHAGLFRLIAGDWGGAAVMTAALGWAYLLYEWVHLRIHEGTPRHGLLRYLQRRHLQHHFADDGRNFGVTSPLWDLIGRTNRSRNASLSARALLT